MCPKCTTSVCIVFFKFFRHPFASFTSSRIFTFLWLWHEQSSKQCTPWCRDLELIIMAMFSSQLEFVELYHFNAREPYGSREEGGMHQHQQHYLCVSVLFTRTEHTTARAIKSRLVWWSGSLNMGPILCKCIGSLYLQREESWYDSFNLLLNTKKNYVILKRYWIYLHTYTNHPLKRMAAQKTLKHSLLRTPTCSARHKLLCTCFRY